jgi:hypothetical protein
MIVPLLVLWLSGAQPAPTEAIVAKGETLEHVASRTLGDVRAASELRALNVLQGDQPAAGTRLKLPGPERDRARSALSAAWATVRQRDAGTTGPAAGELTEAERLFSAARYAEAARLADAAWARVSDGAEAQHFSVQVAADGGATEVTAHSGTPVRVSAQGVTRAVHAGHAVRVERGEAPPVAGPTRPPRVALGIPLPVSPASGELLRQRPVGRGLEPVTVRWTAVEGADGYVVTLARGSRRWTVRSTRLDAQLPSMRPGTYRWSVRAVLGDQEGEASAPVRFRIEEEPLELEVKGSGWK